MVVIVIIIGWTLLGMLICAAFGKLAQVKMNKWMNRELSQEEIERMFNRAAFMEGREIVTEYSIWAWAWDGFTWPWTLWMAHKGDKKLKEYYKNGG